MVLILYLPGSSKPNIVREDGSPIDIVVTLNSINPIYTTVLRFKRTFKLQNHKTLLIVTKQVILGNPITTQE